MRKIIFSIVICITALTASISAYAATTDAVQETNLVHSTIAQYGSDYEAPFVAPGSAVDSSNGAVTMRELEISLPGKNGFDLNLYREYSSYEMNYGRYYQEYESKKTLRVSLMVPYRVNGTGELYYVERENEADIYETLYTTTSALDNLSLDEYGDEYIPMSKISKTSGEVTLIWDKNTSPSEVYKRKLFKRSRVSRSSSNVNIGNGWYIMIPHISEVTSYSKTSSTDRFYAEVYFPNGTRETLSFSSTYNSSTSSEPSHYDIWSISISGDECDRYNAEIYAGEQVSSLGFSYNYEISAYDGTVYYFLGNPSKNANAKIQAMSDKYGNTIRYERPESGGLHIIDTMSRVVTFQSGITVTAGDMTKTITYSTETILDTENDPNNYYYTFSKKKLTVSETDGTADGTKQTEYIMKNECISPENGTYNQYSDIVPVLLEVKYPTNVRYEYTYETEPDAAQYYWYVDGTTMSNTTPHFYLYKVIGEKVYENDVLKASRSFEYDGTWHRAYEPKLTNRKTFISTETLENGTVKTVNNEYDGFGRLLAEETILDGVEDHTLRTEYYYHNGYPDNTIDSSLSILRTIRTGLLRCIVNYEDGKYVSSTDSNYNKTSRQPLYTEFGEKKTTYTYNTTYYMPLTTVENRLGKNDIKKSNTLTSDKKSIATSRVYEGSTEKSRTDYTYNSDGTIATMTAYNNSENTITEYTYSYADDCSYTVSATVKDVWSITGDVEASVDTDGYDINVSGYKKAEVLFCNPYINYSENTGHRIVYLDGTETEDTQFGRGWVDTAVYDLSGVNTLTFDVTYGSYNVKVRLIPNDADANMIGGASRKVTTTYTGDSTYVKPTSVVTTNGYGNVVEESFYNGTVSDANLLNRNKYKYDYQGNVLETVGGRVYMENLGTYSTKTEYDYAGRPVKEYRANGDYITKTYDKLGNMISSTDYMGNTTSYTYDCLGRQTRVQTPFADSQTTKTLTYYDKNGNIIKTRQQNNKIGEATTYAETISEYDSRNRLSLTKVNDGERDIYTQYEYDNVGNMTAYVTGHTEETTIYNAAMNNSNTTYSIYEYDRFGNVTREIDSLGNFKTATYNLYGLPTEETNKNGKTFYYMYNAFGSPTWVEDDGIGEIYYMLYGYNVYNMPLMYWDDENVEQTTLTYDEYGYVKEETDESVQTSSVYTNDVNGNRKRLEVKDGNTTVMTANYTYDILDRLTNVSFDNGAASVSYT